MLQLEQTFFDLASTSKTDTIVICDRGAMDPSSCKSTELLPYNFFKFQIPFLGKGIETLKEEEERFWVMFNSMWELNQNGSV